MQPSERFRIDYTFCLNIAFFFGTTFLFWLRSTDEHKHGGEEQSLEHAEEESWSDRLLTGVAYLSFVWLAGGVVVCLLN